MRMWMSGVWDCLRCGAWGEGEGEGHVCPAKAEAKGQTGEKPNEAGIETDPSENSEG